jgi:hypothetical protein
MENASDLVAVVLVTLPSPWLFLIGALATWRVWQFLADDTLLDHWRIRDRIAPPDSLRHEFIHCPYCLGFHLSLLLTILWCTADGWPGWQSFLAVWWALSAAVVAVEITQDRITS